MKIILTIINFVFLSILVTSCQHSNTIKPSVSKISHQPEVIDKSCRDGNAKLYDECNNQIQILQKAVQQASNENKNVIVVYGGEWCIWCHVLDKYFHGQFRTFDYKWRDSSGDIFEWLMNETVTQTEIDDAIALNQFVADNFVVAHIESEYTNGRDAIDSTGFDSSNIYYYPYIFVLNEQGQYVSSMPSTDAIENFEIRESGGEEYRGYNRKILLEQLKKLKIDTNNE
ncbi:hypothetical protein VH441_00735 [Psychrobacter sp. HD31]|uniref:hypothetical protein n=1 Tax=Psychrobacter sp. HD31 TaxID=3112003 RepID=UPI003DA4B5AD